MAKKGQKFEKYTPEFRHKVVMEKINKGTSYSTLGKKYKMSWKTIDSWVRKYKRQGHLEEQKRGRPNQSEEVDYKEKYEILKKFLESLEEGEQEKK
ncbi:transposase [Patescibacteria group bacterium]|nr:transposase [Patescibacteria group bacterium]